MIVFIPDMILKNWAEKNLPYDREIRKGPFRFRLVHNRGAFLNLGERAPHVVAALSVFLCLALIPANILAWVKGWSRLVKAALALFFEGGLSNVCDRIRKKYVVDYIGFGNKDIFYNLGDVAIFAGAFLWIMSALRKE